MVFHGATVTTLLCSCCTAVETVMALLPSCRMFRNFRPMGESVVHLYETDLSGMRIIFVADFGSSCVHI